MRPQRHACRDRRMAHVVTPSWTALITTTCDDVSS